MRPTNLFKRLKGMPTVARYRKTIIFTHNHAHYYSHLGFDLEWRVLWNSGAQERRTALVQLCDKSTILLIQVNYMKRALFVNYALLPFDNLAVWQGFRKKSG